MKWSEMGFDAQCDALCMAIDPVEEIAADKELLRLLRDKKPWQAAGRILRDHRGAVRTILAAFDGVPVESVRLNLLALPGKIVEILSNPDFIALFTLQLPPLGQMYSGNASAPVGEAGAGVDPA